MDASTLVERQKLSLRDKVELTLQRITEWENHWDGMVYISFSGGKDSTVLAHLADQVCPDIPLVFCDTGLEYPEVRSFALSMADEVLHPKKTFKQVIEDYGYPFPTKEQSRYVYEARHSTEKLRAKRLDFGSSYALSRKWEPLLDAPFEVNDRCCYIMKKAPFKSYEGRTSRKPITATMAEESALRKNRYITNGGCNAFDLKRPVSNPMGFWTEQDVLRYILDNGIEIPSVYGEIAERERESDSSLYCTGCDRTGCMFCMFGVHLESRPNRFERMRETHPKQYAYCMDKLGCAQVLDYVGVPH